LNSTRYL